MTRHDPSDPTNPAVEVGQRITDLRTRVVQADQRVGRSHVQTARLDQPAPSTTSSIPVNVYALTVVGNPDRLVAIVDTDVPSGTTGFVAISTGVGDPLLSVGVGGSDTGRMTLGPVDVPPDNNLTIAIWRASGTGAISARLIAAWVPDV